jgi:hypothetical protein
VCVFGARPAIGDTGKHVGQVGDGTDLLGAMLVRTETTSAVWAYHDALGSSTDRRKKRVSMGRSHRDLGVEKPYEDENGRLRNDIGACVLIEI